MISGKDELEELKFDPEEYSKFVNDLICDHKLKKIKSITSYLIISICENFPGLTRHITEYCIEAICLGTQTTSINKCKYVQSSDKILQFNNIISQVETCLLILCIIADEILKSYELL